MSKMKKAKVSNPEYLYRDLWSYFDDGEELVSQFSVDVLDSKYNRTRLNNTIVGIANLLRKHDLQGYILKELDIPTRKQKPLTRILNAFGKMRRAPNKPGTWWVKNREGMKLLLDSQDFPKLPEDGGDLKFEMEGFTVYNTVRAEGKELKDIHQIIKRGVNFMKVNQSRIPVIPKLLYGDLNIVEKIKGGRVLAWYSLQKDTVSVRTRIPMGADAVHSFIHELGHRWWNRFLSKETQKAWVRHHRDLTYKKYDGELPKVGEEIGFKVSGYYGKIPKILRIEGDLYIMGLEGRTTKSIKRMHLKKILRKRNFPTSYASTDPEEHFCESFAMYCMGTLSDDHMASFEAVVLNMKTSDPASNVIENVVKPKAPVQTYMPEYNTVVDKLSKEFGPATTSFQGGKHESVIKTVLETMMDSINYEMTFSHQQNDDYLVLTVEPQTFDHNIQNMKFSLLQPDKTVSEIKRELLRYTESLEDLL